MALRVWSATGTARGKECTIWWKVHEPDAVELQPDKVLQDRFDQGQAVGELATTLFSGGVLIDLPHDAVEQRIEETREAIAGEAPAVFEASFLEHKTFVAVDILGLPSSATPPIGRRSPTQ